MDNHRFRAWVFRWLVEILLVVLLIVVIIHAILFIYAVHHILQPKLTSAKFLSKVMWGAFFSFQRTYPVLTQSPTYVQYSRRHSLYCTVE